MKFIAHRINTIKKLNKISRNYGVEIDIRSFGKKLILSHDAHKKGEELKKFLKNYKHSLLVANIKEAGIEDKVIKRFFLDEIGAFDVSSAENIFKYL